MHEAFLQGNRRWKFVPSRQNLMELGSEALATLRNSLMRNLWLCPLTNMLPVDPVRAEDGNVYERRAIHGWIYEAQFLAPPRLCSPVTGKPMGSRLTSCFEVRNSIDLLVRRGWLRGPVAERWVERQVEDAQVAEAARIIQAR
ncbi:hypothetical protein EMIHUDRAFT_210544 [Emiliania huxleyi CCMP1516]|uniref:U-box domain-containing protein n=2 Tax=Emiliania huxleyi TaxID=2903 RepID=A0A0D3IYA3_EMIH1|nr:hypothetical protein EMIHUDRAFT_210544 [Emiliania huxleyi CCMP1516]EOD16238.1 hypothetical protein EMIHUDRAFT_210544 [Emiliania huxleyi CCMP1516]|eukprot:XP_005768667.1 hypothetical protein EMIHUDRAFT_210544 [Emiliania huxleyi CCMP1516]